MNSTNRTSLSLDTRVERAGQLALSVMSLLLRFRCPSRRDGCSASTHPGAIPADASAATSWMANVAVVLDRPLLLHRHVLQLPLSIRVTRMTPRWSRAPTFAIKIAIELQLHRRVFPSTIVVPLLRVRVRLWVYIPRW